LTDLEHPFARGEALYDITFENVQAGLRTDYLLRLANQHGALVVGTGDLSELALGWCTYGIGDHMSHYNINASVAKTLIQHLIRFVAGSGEVDECTARVLHAILATEISPELVPVRAGESLQSSEKMTGPYALRDFNFFTDALWIPTVQDRVSRTSCLGRGCPRHLAFRHSPEPAESLCAW
jgi:NAD+ synthase (glutamine-hydrolysing)